MQDDSASSGPTPTEAAAAPAVKPKRRRRWLRRLVVALALLMIAGGLATWWLLGNLQTEAVRETAASVVFDQTGITFDYRTLAVTADGVLMEDVVVQSAAADREVAPEFLHIDRLMVAWQIGDLLTMHRKIQLVKVAGVRLHVVIDEDGSNSVVRLLAGLPKSEDTEPAKPLSQSLLALQGGLQATLESLQVPGIRLTVSLRRAGVERRRIVLGDFALHGRAVVGVARPELDLRLSADAAGAALDVSAGLGAEAGAVATLPAALTPILVGPLAPVADWWQRGVRLPLDVSARVALGHAQEVNIAGSLGVQKGFAWPPGLGVQTLSEAGLRLAFEPEAGRIVLAMEKAAALDERATMTLRATLSDKAGGGATAALEELRAAVQLDGLGGLLPAKYGRLRLSEVAGKLAIDDLRLDGAGGLPTLKRLQAGADIGSLDAAMAGRRLSLKGGRFGAVLSRDAAGRLRVRLSGPIASLRLSDTGLKARAGLQGLDAALAIDDLMVTMPGGGAVPVVSGGRLSGHGRLASLEAVAAAAAVTVTGARTRFDGLMDERGADLAVTADLRGVQAFATEASADAVLGPLEVSLTVADRGDKPLLRGGPLSGLVIAFEARLDKLAAGLPGLRAKLRGARADLRLSGLSAPPLDAVLALNSLDLKASLASVQGDGYGPLAGLSVTLKARDLRPDTARLLASTGKVEFDARVGPLGGNARLDKGADHLRWEGAMAVPDFAAVPSLARLPAALVTMLDWRRLSFAAETRGIARGLLRGGVPDLEHVSKVSVKGLHGRGGGVAFDLDTVVANLSGANSGTRHDLRWDVRLPNPHVGRYRGVGAHALVGEGSVEPARPHVVLKMRAEAPAGPRLEGDMSAGWDPAKGGLSYAIAGNIAKLAAIGRALPADVRKAACIDLDRLAASFAASGLVRTSRSKLMDGSAFSGPGLVKRIHTSHRLSGKASRVFCSNDGFEIDVGEADFDTAITLAGGELQVQGKAAAPKLRFDAAGVHGKIEGLSGGFSVATGMLAGRTETEITFDGAIGHLKQNAVPQYPIGKATVHGKVRMDRPGSVRLQTLTLRNGLGGSEVEVHGGVDIGERRSAAAGSSGTAAAAAAQSVPGRQGVSLQGELRQDLGVLASSTKLMEAKGRIVVPFRVESGDMKVIRAEADVRMADLAVKVEQLDAWIAGVNGTMPVYQEIALGGPRGVTWLGGGASNAYSRWRFQDQRPFLSGNYYVSVAEVGYGDVRIGPIAGNAIVDRNVLRLDQLEMEAAGGTITGQCIIDLRGRETEMMFRGNLTGLRASNNEDRFDANAAITFLPGQMSLSGRAQVLQLGRRHLLDMMDLWDPYHEDVRANQLRMALKVGHPQRAHMRFQHGFMDMGVTMGGLASAVRLGEIRGVPLGPMMQKYLGPLMDRILGEAQPAPKPGNKGDKAGRGASKAVESKP